MTWQDHKTAIEIINGCDCLSITEDDKEIIISIFSTIIKSLREIGLANDAMAAQHAVLRVSTWNNGYFCTVARQMCSIVYPVVKFCAENLTLEV